LFRSAGNPSLDDTLSILIITYNNENHILACLNSITWHPKNLDMCIVDNHSRDGTRKNIELFCRIHGDYQIRKIWNGSNQGYAAAINQGLTLCAGAWILLLGPDTRILPGALEKMRAHLAANPKTGMVAPRLVDSNGRTHDSVRRFPTSMDVLLEITGLPRMFPERFRPYWKNSGIENRLVQKVEQPEATCIMVRRDAYTGVGLMDERFPLFFNDVDWCVRFRKAGWDIDFIQDAVVEHIRGASVNRTPLIKIWRSHQGFYRYFQKYRTSPAAKLSNQGIGFLLIITAFYRSAIAFLCKNYGKPA